MKKIDITEYLYYKLAQSLIFDDEIMECIKEGDYDLHIFHTNFLNGFYDFIEFMSKNNYLEDKYKSRAYDLILYMREQLDNTDVSFSATIEKLNSIIYMLNKSNGENSDDFYLKEMGVRISFLAHRKSKSITLSDEEYFKYKKIVLESMIHDYTVLLFNLDCIDEEEYENSFMEIYALNAYYYYSLRALFIEKPEISAIIKLRERINKMLDYNMKNINKLNEHIGSDMLDNNMLNKSAQKSIKRQIINETKQLKKYF